jgi:hypothetical protein
LEGSDGPTSALVAFLALLTFRAYGLLLNGVRKTCLSALREHTHLEKKRVVGQSGKKKTG